MLTGNTWLVANAIHFAERQWVIQNCDLVSNVDGFIVEPFLVECIFQLLLKDIPIKQVV